MNEIPMWWLVLSAIFFFIITIAFVGMAVTLWKVVGVVTQLQPKVEQLVTTVDGVATKVDGLTTTVHNTIRNVGEKAQGVAGSASSMAQVTSTVFERYAPILGVVLTGLKVLGAIREYRHRGEKVETEEES